MIRQPAQLSSLPLLLRGRWLYRFGVQGWTREALDEANVVLQLRGHEYRRLLPVLERHLHDASGLRPLDAAALAERAWRRIGLADVHSINPRLPLTALPTRLVEADTDRYGRSLRLLPAAAHALERLRREARRDGVSIEIVSGFRSPGYQARLWQRKLAAGQKLADIAKVSAPPGRSEHHSGRAVDLASGPGPVLEASFAKTPAYRWLRQNAARFGFVETYPKGNPYGVVAEPWHWCWQGSSSSQ
jgi:LAS superfamily LD-carboxypeptidase LdcB